MLLDWETRRHHRPAQLFSLWAAFLAMLAINGYIYHATALTREKRATLIRLALRAGLPVVLNRFQSPRQEGYFASDYPMPKERLELEAAMAKVKVKPDRQ